MGEKGVEVNWLMNSIDGQSYTEELLDQRIAGAATYTVTFKKPETQARLPDAMPDDVEDAISSQGGIDGVSFWTCCPGRTHLADTSQRGAARSDVQLAASPIPDGDTEELRRWRDQMHT